MTERAVWRAVSCSGIESAGRREQRGNTTAGRQDKARFLAAGTSFLSFCLHIVFAGLAL